MVAPVLERAPGRAAFHPDLISTVSRRLRLHFPLLTLAVAGAYEGAGPIAATGDGTVHARGLEYLGAPCFRIVQAQFRRMPANSRDWSPARRLNTDAPGEKATPTHAALCPGPVPNAVPSF